MAETTFKLTWDENGKHFYETGVSKGVLYVQGNGGTYPKGVAWNGLINVTEKPTGAEATPLYADNIKYLNLMSTEEYEASLECYTYPDEFSECDGSATIADGVMIGQQKRKTFGLCYRTIVGNDTSGEEYGYKLHLVYGAVASPSEKAYATVNNNPEAITFSYSLKTTPVAVKGHKPTACITIDSTKVPKEKMTSLEGILYGSGETEARLPLPDEIATLIGTTQAAG